MARLIQIINTSEFTSPSPDPAGIVYLSDSNRLLISDSEVNETPIFQGDNLFTTTFEGSIINFGNVLGFSSEPTGLAYNANNGRLFISDDAERRIVTLTDGGDDLFGQDNDNFVNQFPTRPFGSDDPEDLVFHPDTGTLFIADGLDNVIYEVDTQGNLIDSFNTASFGLSDPEGIGLNTTNGNFLIVGEPSNQLFEVTVDGNLVQTIDISAANPIQPAGVTMSPSSEDSSQFNVYIVDRGIDEREDINENDGQLYEFSLEDEDEPDPPNAPDNVIYATSRDTVTLNGNNFAEEDVLVFDPNTNTWSQYIDGSDLGLANRDIDGLHVNDDGSVLLSLNQDGNVNGFGFVDDADIIRFVPSSTGENTSGSFERYFDGSDVGLDVNTEDIDAISIADNGDILISTNGSYNITGLSGNDEDILAFSPSNLGDNTTGSFSLYVDGSDVGLNDNSGEDIKGVSALNNGDLVFSTLGNFQVAELSGNGSDLLSFNSSSLGDNTSGSFSSFADGTSNGFGSQVIADISIV